MPPLPLAATSGARHRRAGYRVTWARRQGGWFRSRGRGRSGCLSGWGTLGTRVATAATCPTQSDPAAPELPLRQTGPGPLVTHILPHSPAALVGRPTHLTLLVGCRWRSPPSPSACRGWWREWGCRWPAGSPLEPNHIPVFTTAALRNVLLEERILLTQSLVVVLRVARQSEERRSHLLATLVQVLRTHTHTHTHGETGAFASPLAHWPETVGLTRHLHELGVALAAAGAVVVLQELAQQSHALLHFLDGVHPLGHLLRPLLVLRGGSARARELGGPRWNDCATGQRFTSWTISLMSLLAAFRSSGCELFSRRDNIWHGAGRANTHSYDDASTKANKNKRIPSQSDACPRTSTYFWLLLVLKDGVLGSGRRKVQQFVGRQLRVLFNDTWRAKREGAAPGGDYRLGQRRFPGLVWREAPVYLASSASGRHLRSWPHRVRQQSNCRSTPEPSFSPAQVSVSPGTDIDNQVSNTKHTPQKNCCQGSIDALAATRTSYLGRNHLDELIEKAELAHFAVQPLATVFHTGFQNLEGKKLPETQVNPAKLKNIHWQFQLFLVYSWYNSKSVPSLKRTSESHLPSCSTHTFPLSRLPRLLSFTDTSSHLSTKTSSHHHCEARKSLLRTV